MSVSIDTWSKMAADSTGEPVVSSADFEHFSTVESYEWKCQVALESRICPVSAGGKKKKKAKGKTLPLTDFLADTSTGQSFPRDPPKHSSTSSWADASDDIDPSGTGEFKLHRQLGSRSPVNSLLAQRFSVINRLAAYQL